jgi:DNA-binding NarL/FixJ family response regulator
LDFVWSLIPKRPSIPIGFLALIREGVAALIANQQDMRLVGEASNGREAIEQFRSHRPDVTLMDLQCQR